MATNQLKSLPVKNACSVYLAPDGIYCQKDKKIYRCSYNGKTKKVLLKGYDLHRMDDDNIYVFKARKKAKITDEYRYNIRTKKLKRIESYNNDF